MIDANAVFFGKCESKLPGIHAQAPFLLFLKFYHLIKFLPVQR